MYWETAGARPFPKSSILLENGGLLEMLSKTNECAGLPASRTPAHLQGGQWSLG